MLRVEEIDKIVEGIGEQFNDDILMRFYDKSKDLYVCEFVPAEYYNNATPIIEILQDYKRVCSFGRFTYDRENYKIIAIEFDMVATE
jgi:hypothetical protein